MRVLAVEFRIGNRWSLRILCVDLDVGVMRLRGENHVLRSELLALQLNAQQLWTRHSCSPGVLESWRPWTLD